MSTQPLSVCWNLYLAVGVLIHCEVVITEVMQRSREAAHPEQILNVGTREAVPKIQGREMASDS